MFTRGVMVGMGGGKGWRMTHCWSCEQVLGDKELFDRKEVVRGNTKPFGGIGKRCEEVTGEDAGDKLALEIICSVEQDVEDKEGASILE